jgi:hypothetical protein
LYFTVYTCTILRPRKPIVEKSPLRSKWLDWPLFQLRSTGIVPLGGSVEPVNLAIIH